MPHKAGMLYEVALIQNPTKTEAENGSLGKLIMPPVYVMAKSEQAAGVQAVMANKEKLPDELERVEVLVRPFQ